SEHSSSLSLCRSKLAPTLQSSSTMIAMTVSALSSTRFFYQERSYGVLKSRNSAGYQIFFIIYFFFFFNHTNRTVFIFFQNQVCNFHQKSQTPVFKQKTTCAPP